MIPTKFNKIKINKSSNNVRIYKASTVYSKIEKINNIDLACYNAPSVH